MINLVSKTYTIATEPELFDKFDKKRGKISRSKIVSELLKLYVDDKIVLNISENDSDAEELISTEESIPTEVKEKSKEEIKIEESIPTPDTPMKE